MAVTYGFYNALNHDRVYDAIQMSSIFDGIIQDGVFSTVGNSLICQAPETGLIVNVGSGRAWFNHTWTLNDTDYPVEAEEAEVVLNRIDAVVLEVNSAVEVRANTIKFVKGTPSSNPVRPTMIHNAEVNQYALAYVSIRAGQTTIFQSDITNVVGTDETPFVTGLLQQLSIEDLILQWEAEFNVHFANWEAVNEAEYESWTTEMKNQYNLWLAGRVAEYQAWYAQMQAEGDADLAEFDAWFQSMKDQLSTDAAGHLQAEIDALALDAEKGSIVTVTTINSSLYGRTVTISQNGQSRTATFDNNGVAVFESIPYIGNVDVSATDGSQTATAVLNIPYFGRYSIPIAFWAATINISTTSPEFYGRTITVAKDGSTVGTIAFSALGVATYIASSVGSYDFTVSYDGMEFTSNVNVTEETTYSTVINAWTATFNMTASISTLYNRAIIISKGGTTVGTTAFDSTGHATYKVHEAGVYSVSSTDSGGKTYSKTVSVTAEEGYNINLGTITKIFDLYSAVSDTVSFTDITGAKTCVTDGAGHGQVTITCEPGATITFTSAVAKNAKNTSLAYTKDIQINDDEVTELYIMPDNVYYWYGYIPTGVSFTSYAVKWSTGTGKPVSWGYRTNYMQACITGYGGADSVVGTTSGVVHDYDGKYVRSHYTISSSGVPYCSDYIAAGTISGSSGNISGARADTNSPMSLSLVNPILGIWQHNGSGQTPSNTVYLYSLYLSDTP